MTIHDISEEAQIAHLERTIRHGDHRTAIFFRQ
jgi:hypothetical protein